MEEIAHSNFRTRLSITLSWVMLVAFLFLVDDALIGPVCWAIVAVATHLVGEWGRFLVTLVAFMAVFAFQLWSNYQAMKPFPGPYVQRMTQLLLGRRQTARLDERMDSVKRRLASRASALALSLVVGGIFPILFLYERELLEVRDLRRLAIWTSAIYAAEFALIHGGYGLGAVVVWALDIVAVW